MAKHGLFVGLVTLDLIYLANSPPERNQKIVAKTATIAAGGPATNAAVAFGYLGNQATVLGVVGVHPMAHLIQSDLEQWGVTIVDLDPTRSNPPPISSIVVTESTGDRAVVSLNAVNAQMSVDAIPSNVLDGIDIVLIDGHQMQVGAKIAQLAKARGIPVVIDGGSWKPGFETVLPYVNYAVCSANFRAPTGQDVFTYLAEFGISHIAVTQGGSAIAAIKAGDRHMIKVPQVSVVDTLGAGDIFHGAFCQFILETEFTEALSEAAKIAAFSCRSFGTRDWMTRN